MAEKKAEIKAKVLVLDDSDYSRKNVIQILEKNSFLVVGEASNVKAAGDLIASTKTNVLVMDLIMPEKSGVELTKHFRENFHDLSIIIISPMYHEQVVLDCLTQGACNFLKKPVSEKLLCDTIGKIQDGLKED